MKRNNKFSRSKPTVHNQKKPFNPQKYGKVWGSIDFEMAHGTKAMNPVPPSTQPIMGTLVIGGKRVEITFSEANRIIETLQDSQYRFNVAKKMGMLEAGHGTYRG